MVAVLEIIRDETDARTRESNENKLKESEEKKKKLRRWKFPKVEDYECKSRINFSEFKKKFEAKLTKIEKEIPQKIEIKCKDLIGNTVVCSLFCQYFKELEQKDIKDQDNLNIFWFEASNKINFYLQLFDLGLSEEIFHETIENFGNFEEILIRILQKNITNESKLLFIFNNFNNEINIEKLVHHRRIKCVLLRTGIQQKTTQKVKKSEKNKITEDAPKIHKFHWNFRRKLKFKYKPVSTQEEIELPEINSTDIMPKPTIIIPTSFLEILENFSLLETVPNKDYVNKISDYRENLQNFLESLEPAVVPYDFYYTKNRKILEKILPNICSDEYICQMSIDWINTKLNGKCTKFETKLINFFEILIKSLISPESVAHGDILKIMKERIIQIHEIIIPKTALIVPTSFVEILQGFCNLQDILTIETFENTFENTLRILETTEQQYLQVQDKFQYFLTKFHLMGVPAEYYYTKNQNKIKEILDKICQDEFTCKIVTWEWMSQIIDRKCTIERNDLAFVEILLVSFITFNYDNALEYPLTILGIIDKVGKWFKYFQNKDIIGNYFVKFCNGLELDIKNAQGEEIYNKIMIQVIELFVKVCPKTGLRICEQVLVKYKQNSTFLQVSVKVPEEIYTFRILKAKCLFKKGSLAAALNILQDLLQYTGKDYLENLKLIISSEIELSKEYFKSTPQDTQKGFDILEKNQDLIIEIGKENILYYGYTSVLEGLALYRMNKGEYSVALEILEKILEIQNLCQDGVKNIARTLTIISNVTFNLGREELISFKKSNILKNLSEFKNLENFEKSFETLKTVLEICLNGQFKFPLGNLLFYFKGNKSWEFLPSVTEGFTKMVNFYNRFKFKIFDPQPQSPSANLLFEEWKSEIISNQQDLEIVENDRIVEKLKSKINGFKNGSKFIKLREAEIYQWIGHCHNHGDSDMAISYFERSKEILEKFKNPIDLDLASIYYSLCQVHHIRGDKNSAIQYFKKAYLQFKSSSNVDGIHILMENVKDILQTDILQTDLTDEFRIWLDSVPMIIFRKLIWNGLSNK